MRAQPCKGPEAASPTGLRHGLESGFSPLGHRQPQGVGRSGGVPQTALVPGAERLCRADRGERAKGHREWGCTRVFTRGGLSDTCCEWKPGRGPFPGLCGGPCGPQTQVPVWNGAWRRPRTRGSQAPPGLLSEGGETSSAQGWVVPRPRPWRASAPSPLGRPPLAGEYNPQETPPLETPAHAALDAARSSSPPRGRSGPGRESPAGRGPGGQGAVPTLGLVPISLQLTSGVIVCCARFLIFPFLKVRPGLGPDPPAPPL